MQKEEPMPTTDSDERMADREREARIEELAKDVFAWFDEVGERIMNYPMYAIRKQLLMPCFGSSRIRELVLIVFNDGEPCSQDRIEELAREYVDKEMRNG